MALCLVIVAAVAAAEPSSIFVFDHENMADLFGTSVVSRKAWSRYSALFTGRPAFLEADHDFAEYEVALTVREAVASAGLEAASRDSAGVVFVALWEFGLCELLHSDLLFEWEKQKGVLASHVNDKCPELVALYSLVSSLPGQQRTAFLVDKLKHKSLAVPWQIRHNAILVGVEERRWYTGCSTHLPIPYFVEPSKWRFENSDTTEEEEEEGRKKTLLVGFVGSVGVLYSMCEACHWWFDPSLLRKRLVDHVRRGCERANQPCHLRSIDSRFWDRHNVSLLDKTESIASVMRRSRFCLIPRGDSASTKRFFSAIFALCIPVLVSDHFPLPFQDAIDYDAFVLRVPEWRFLWPGFSNHSGTHSADATDTNKDHHTTVFDDIMDFHRDRKRRRRAVRAMHRARRHLAFAGPQATAIHNLVSNLAKATPYATSTTPVPGIATFPPTPAVLPRRAPDCPLTDRPDFSKADNYTQFWIHWSLGW